MWKSFKSLFAEKDRAAVAEDQAISELADKYGIPLLTERSQRAEPPAVCAVKLWDHQKAMLARCRNIEANPRSVQPVVKNKERYWDKTLAPDLSNNRINIGVMNDLPGSGKTYAILSLLADSKEFNLIVVPQNIYHQWQRAIETMFPDPARVKYKFVQTYGDITSMYGGMMGHAQVNKLRDYNIVLVNDIFAELLATTINDTKIQVKRIVIDEIDSVQQRLHTPIPCKHLWLMSASFAFEKGAAVGPYLISAQDIPYTFCKCDAGFISRGLRLEDPTTEKIQCEDKDIQLFQGVMQKKTMDALHAGDTHGVYQEMERPYRANQHTLLDLAKMYVKDNETIEEKIAYYASEYKKYALSGDKGAEEEFFKKLQNEKRKKDIRDELSRRIATFGEPADPAKVKWAVFENDIRQRILATPTSKWLIFNDNATAVYDAVERLRAAGIKCTTLDGGNATAIQRAIDSYKGEDAQVLLLNSKLEAVGMNLENTTHLLFMHATRPQYVEQIVGRAQRYGRPGRLHIIGLFNRGEDPTGAA